MTNLEADSSVLPGYVEPIIGRVLVEDIRGIFGLTIARKGDVVTPFIYERAEQVGRLRELIIATRPQSENRS
jgi:hypothetical protein